MGPYVRWRPPVADARRLFDDTQRWTLLSEVSGMLLSSLDYQTSLSRLANLLVPRLGDCCVLQLSDGIEAPAFAAVALAPHLSALTGQIQEIAEHTSLIHHPGNNAAEAHELIREAIGASVVQTIPLRARGRTLGAMLLAVTDGGQVFLDAEAPLADEIATRTALAVDNARVYQAAREGIRIRDEVLGMVSHDLKNPLTVVAGTVRFLLDTLPEIELLGSRRAHLQRVLRATGQMSQIIQNLLDQVSIQSGRLALTVQPESAGGIVADAVDMFRLLAEGASVRLEADVPGTPEMVTCDRARILQVLSNLIGNAVRHTPPGGRITVSYRKDPRGVVFGVADTGCGIAPEQLPRLFDRYWRPARTHRSGTGLGLMIAHGIVAAHEGKIWAESTLGQGTALFFLIPTSRYE